MDNIFELIANNYTPAVDLADADYTPTTEELYEKLVKHTGKGDISIEAVFMGMEDMGFKSMDIGELYFVWLMTGDHPVLMEREDMV